MIVINEFLADPPAGVAGDSNADGVTSTSQDEFVELLNLGSMTVDLSGWMLRDSASTRHIFPSGTSVLANHFLVVFGGGSPNLPGIQTQIASNGGLSLNNTGDTISLFWNTNDLEVQVIYGADGNKDQSLVRVPEGAGINFILHTLAPGAGGDIFSPGTTVDGKSEFSPPATVPEVSSLCCLGMGFLGMLRKRRKTGWTNS